MGISAIWGALATIYPSCAEQRCWNHNLLNVLDQVPLKKQAAVKVWLRKIMFAETRDAAERLRKQCVAQYRKLFPKGMAALEREWDRMVTYYEYPQEHGKHLRTTNVVESPSRLSACVRPHAKRFKRVENACALIRKLLSVAKTFRKLAVAELLKDVAAGRKYVNGIAVTEPGRRLTLVYTPIDESSQLPPEKPGTPFAAKTASSTRRPSAQEYQQVDDR